MQRKYARWLIVTASLFCCLSLSGSHRAIAQGLVSARVTDIIGKVEIQRTATPTAKFVKIALADELQPGDTIKTGGSSRVVLELSDGSLAVFGDDTTVRVGKLNGSPREFLEVLKGKTRIHIEHLGGKPNPYQVTTPTVVIAVRGTTFDVSVKKQTTEVFVHEGSVEVTNLQHPGRPVLLHPFERIKVSGDQAPGAPRDFKRGQNDDEFSKPREIGQDGFGDRSDRNGRGSGEDRSGRSDSRGDRGDGSMMGGRDSGSSGDHGSGSSGSGGGSSSGPGRGTTPPKIRKP